MKIDTSLSRYAEDPGASVEFDRGELFHLRYLLRRLQYLEHQVREKGGMAAGENGGGVHAEMEMNSLEWALEELQFITVAARAVSGNQGRSA